MASFKLSPDRDAPSGWNILNLFNIPVYVEGSFLLFIALLFVLNADGGGMDIPKLGLVGFVIFFSLLVHEYGHALTAKSMGCDSIRIALVMMGGYATHSPTTRGKSLLIIAAGPGAGLLLGVICLLLSRDGRIYNIAPEEPMRFVLQNLIFINIFWSLLNLIPIHPMDGGQAVFHALTYKLDGATAMLYVARLSMFLAVVVGIIGFKIGLIILPILCLSFFMRNYQIAQILGRS